MRKSTFLRIFTLLGAAVLVMTSCTKDHGDDIKKLQDQVNDLVSSVSDLKTKVNGAVKSAAFDKATGKLTITSIDGTATDLQLLTGTPVYNVEIVGGKLMVDGVDKGSVSTGSMDASAFGVSTDGFLTVNGSKTTVKLPADASPLDLEIKLENNQYVVYNGTTKIDGFIPEVKVENGKLYIGGVEQAINMGLSGDAIVFQKNGDEVVGVTITKDGDTITIPVSNGVALASLNVIPTWFDNGEPAVPFYYIYGIDIPASGDPEVAMNSIEEINYRFNPTNAKVNDPSIAWSFLNRVALVTRAEGDYNDLITIKDKNIKSDEIVFSVRGNKNASRALGSFGASVSLRDFIALKAIAPVDVNKPAGDKQTIVSDYTKAVFIQNYAYIGDTVKMTNFGTAPSLPRYDYRTDLDEVKDSGPEMGSNIDVPAENPSDNFGCDHAIAYNEGPYNLHDYVFASVDRLFGRQMMGKTSLTDYSYKFKSIEYVPSYDADGTDQAFFIDLNENTGIFSIKHGTASIKRTPIFEVELIANETNLVIARHYIKFKIVPQIVKPIDPIVVDLGDIPYLDLYTGAATSNGKPGLPTGYGGKYLGLGSDPGTRGVYGIPEYRSKAFVTWQQMNVDVYAKLGLSHQQFKDNYGAPVLTYCHQAEGRLLDDKGELENNMVTTNPSVGTQLVGIWIHPETRFGEHEWTIEFQPNDPTLYPVVSVKFKFDLKQPETPVFDEYYVVKPGNVTGAGAGEGLVMSMTKGKLMNKGLGERYYMQATLRESFIGHMYKEQTAPDPSYVLRSFVERVVNNIVPYAPGVANGSPFADRISGYQMHSFAYDFVDNATFYNTTLIDEAKETPGIINGAINPMNGLETVAPAGLTNKVYSFLRQDIKLSQPIDVDQWTYNVTFRSTYENMCDVDTPWLFRFENPLKVVIAAPILKTETTPDTKLLKDLVTEVSVVGKKVYGTGGTPTLATTYGIPAIANFGWSILYKDLDVDSKLYLSGQTTPPYAVTTTAPFETLFWENKGTKLLEDKKTERLQVVVATDYAIRTVSNEIVLKKTTEF